MGRKNPGAAGSSQLSLSDNPVFRYVKQRIGASDWVLIRGSALVSIGSVVARALAFAFLLILGRVFTSDDYGHIQYVIAMGGLLAIGTQAFGQHVVARFLGGLSDDAEGIRRIQSNGWVILGVLIVLTIALAVPVLSLTGKFEPGMLVIFAASTFFYLYWGMSRGLLAPGRLTAAYLAANTVQIILTVVLLIALRIHSPLLAVSIYGLSFIIPLPFIQMIRPLPFGFSLRSVQWATIRKMVRFSVPVWFSHAGYMLFVAVDTLMVEHFASASTLGSYTLSKTLSSVFIFLPMGISTVLMPHVTEMPRSEHWTLLRKVLLVVLVVSAVMLAIYAPSARWFIIHVYGPDYLPEPGVLMILAVAMVLVGLHSVITAVLVGGDRPHEETISRLAALAVMLPVGWVLIPDTGGLGASVSVLAGISAAIMTNGVLAVVRKRRVRLEGEPDSQAI
jgi:O-antigen/teichoic acid export membrane protein